MRQEDYTYTRQLEMVWPYARLDALPPVYVPAGYTLRTYRLGDEAAWSAVMAAAGFGVWNEPRLHPWRSRILPASWMIIEHTATQQMVATAFALHDHNEDHPCGGELGWVAAEPAHHGHGLGMAVCAAVTTRLLDMGYRNVHLYTEDYRLPALRTYFKLGYVPYFSATLRDVAEIEERWQRVCAAVDWPFAPGQWRMARQGDPFAPVKPLPYNRNGSAP